MQENDFHEVAAENRHSAIDYYCDQYRKMLQECMRDYTKPEIDRAAMDG